MSKNAAILFLSLGCLLSGLLVGVTGTYLVLMPHYTKKGAQVFFTAEAYKLGEAANRSFQAYKHESKPVAIYALSEYLLAMKKAQEIPENVRLVDDRGLYLDMMLTHARLARLYAQTGQTNLSAEHFSEALGCAKQGTPSVTNQASLEQFVDRIDRSAHD